MSYNEIEGWFKKKRFLTTKELIEILSVVFPDAKVGTLSSRLHKMKKDGLIRSIRRGLYAPGSRQEYIPVISSELSRLFKKLKKRFPYLDNLCIWDTIWLNDFTVNQAFSSMVIIETDRDAESAVFQFMKASHSKVFIDPTPKEINNYIVGEVESFVVRPLISEAPVIMYKSVAIPRLEKILVDLVCDNDLYISFQGEELYNIFRRVFEDFSISLSALIRYARRRGRLEEIDRIIGELEEYI